MYCISFVGMVVAQFVVNIILDQFKTYGTQPINRPFNQQVLNNGNPDIQLRLPRSQGGNWQTVNQLQRLAVVILLGWWALGFLQKNCEKTYGPEITYTYY